MCEYCGCQDVEAIKQLTDEHDQIVEMMGAVRAADRRDDLPAMIALSAQLVAALRPHSRIEEEGLFPTMADVFPDHVAALEAEHRVIESVFAAAGDGRAAADPTWRHRVQATLELLREHILKEQDGVFPAALATLTSDEWDTLDALRRTVESLDVRVASDG